MNRLLNRALRAVNDVAVATCRDETPAAFRPELAKIFEALAHLAAAQEAVYKLAPELEYHHDPARSPTAFMTAVGEFASEADTLANAGRIQDALAKLQAARDLEPPPLTYELLSKRIAELNKQVD